MKKLFALMLCAMLALTVCAQAEENLFETLSDLSWSFSSGVGAWSTDMQIQADGSFTGDFHDSDMGDMAAEYPNGTVYSCVFSGQMSLIEQVDENTWRLRVDRLAYEQAEEEIVDGVRYIPAEPYGLSEGDEMILYRPGTPTDALNEDMRLWAHVMYQESPLTLENWFLSSEKNDSGFVGYLPVYLPNPWEDLTEEELKEASGLSFRVPEGAENVIYRYLPSAGLAEIQFTMFHDAFCARIQPMDMEDGQLPDISGMYYTWDNVQPVKIGKSDGTVGIAQDGEDWVELCIWYDAEQRLAYALSVHTSDPDGLDLTALAEQI